MTRQILLSEDSYYQKTDLLQVKDSSGKLINTFVWGVWEPTAFPETQSDVLHRVTDTEVGRLDLISYRYYSNVNLWWVIAYHNNLRDPIMDMASGQVLSIPARNIVQAILLEAGSRKESIE